MKEATSQVSAKGQTTLPIEIRKRLGLRPGDRIAYNVVNNVVHLKKIENVDVKWARAVESTLDEWTGDDDDDL